MVQLAGYASVYGAESLFVDQAGSLYIQTMARGAFDEMVPPTDRLEARVDHEPHRRLGSVGTGELWAGVDAYGLWFTLTPSGPEAAEVVRRVRSGELRGASAAYGVFDEVRTERDGLPLHIVTCLSYLNDVAIVTRGRNPLAGVAIVGAGGREGALAEVRARWGTVRSSPRPTTRTGYQDRVPQRPIETERRRHLLAVCH